MKNKTKYFEEPTATPVAPENDIIRTSEPEEDAPAPEQYELPMIK